MGGALQTLHDRLDGDTITDVLRSLRVRSTVYCRTEFRAPWGFQVRPGDTATFHLVAAGTCWLDVDEVDESVQLEVGDLVLLMTGRGHRVRDDPSSPVERLDDIVRGTPPIDGSMKYGGGGAPTELVCGGFLIEGAQANPLVLSLPPLLHLEGRDPAVATWTERVLDLLHLEVAQPTPGSGAVLSSLADLLLTHAIRTHLVSLANTDAPQVGAMRDGRIAKAVRLIHADPAHSWTVEELATEVAMSRSAFAARFHQLTREAPMRYITRCRLALGASYLAQDGTSLFDIARRTGYDSESSFTRAFSRTFGMAPGAYRRRIQQSDIKIDSATPG